MAMGYENHEESAIQDGVTVSLGNETYYYDNDSFVEAYSHGSDAGVPPPISRPTAVNIIKVIAYVVNIIVTIIGNTIVIMIILRNKNKNMRSATYYYLMNLAIADLIVACFTEWTFLAALLSPESWPFGNFMCKFSTFIQGLSVHVSILTLMVVAGDRYIAILHPIKSRVVKRNAWLVIASVWLFSTAINIPLVIYQHFLEHVWPNGEIRRYCFEHWGVVGKEQWPLAKEMYTFTTFVFVYVVPLVLMSVAYVRIGMTLSYRSISGPGVSVKATISVQDKARKKVVKMMIVVVITFALCWLPYHIYNLYMHIQRAGATMDLDISFFVMWLGYANSAMNPFIYCGFNENFRRGFTDAFTGRWCRKQPSHQKFPTGTTTKSVTTSMLTHTDHIDPTSMESML
nr:neuromedin-K receptor-like [Lytechinus pictus]